MQKILLPDEDAEIGPVPTSAGGQRPEPELDRLSNILGTFNEHFGDIRWEDADRVTQLITETIRARVTADSAFRNARQNSDRQNARIEHDKALLRVMTSVIRDDTSSLRTSKAGAGSCRRHSRTSMCAAWAWVCRTTVSRRAVCPSRSAGGRRIEHPRRRSG